MKDWRGTPIEKGSRVIYVSRQGSTMWVTEGEVVDLIGKNVAVKRLRSSSVAHNIKPDRNVNGRIVYPAVERMTVID